MVTLELTNQWGIDYIEYLIIEDTKILQEKLDKRNKLLSTIKFAKELGDF